MPEHAVAYVDESGSLPDSSQRYIALTAIVTLNPRDLRKVVKRASQRSKKVRLRRQGGREVKWWNAFDTTRQRILQSLAERDVQIYWLIVDKEGQSIADTPENYGLMFCELVQECLPYHPSLDLVVDVHFGTSLQRGNFDRIVTGRLPVAKPRHVDSQQDSIIQLADFAAGAILYRFQGQGEFAKLIEPRIVAGKVVKWKQLVKKK